MRRGWHQQQVPPLRPLPPHPHAHQRRASTAAFRQAPNVTLHSTWFDSFHDTHAQTRAAVSCATYHGRPPVCARTCTAHHACTLLALLARMHHAHHTTPCTPRIRPLARTGPGIKPGTKLDFLGTQVDLAPTILGLAGIPAPDDMVSQTPNKPKTQKNEEQKQRKAWVPTSCCSQRWHSHDSSVARTYTRFTWALETWCCQTTWTLFAFAATTPLHVPSGRRNGRPPKVDCC